MIKTLKYMLLTVAFLSSTGWVWAQGEYPSDTEIEFAERFINAEKELQLGNYEAALVQYDKCLELKGDHDAVWFGKGKVYLETQQLALSEAAFQKAYELDPQNKWYALSYAQSLIEQLQFKEASKIYKGLSEKYVEDTDLHIDYANTLLFAGKAKAAMKIYDEIEEKTGPTHEITQRKYEYFIGEREYDKAADVIKRLIDVYPDDTQLYSMLSELYKVQGKVDEAIEVYKQALDADPTNPIFQLSLAEYYDRAGQIDTAFRYLRQAFGNPNLDIDRKVTVLLRMYGEAEVDLGTRRRVMELCRDVVDTHPDEAKAFSIYGDFLNLDGRIEEALVQFHRAIDIDPSRFAIWSQVLLIESELNMTKELARDSKRAIELFPAQPTVYFFNGIANSQLEQWDEAVRSLRVGSQMVIGNSALSAQMLASLGDAYHEIGRFHSSDSAYEEALSFEPRNAYVLNNYSYFLALRGDKLEKAKEMSALSLEVEPTNASYLDTYGWILYQNGEYEDAASYLKKAMDNGADGSSEVLEHYGDTMFRLNKLDESKVYWQRAVDAGGSSPELKKKLETGSINE